MIIIYIVDGVNVMSELKTESCLEQHDAEHHDRCGEISNIPKCCRDFFNSKAWKEMVECGYSYDYFDIMEFCHGKDVRYVTCPKCTIERKSNVINICTGWCGLKGCELEYESIDKESDRKEIPERAKEYIKRFFASRIPEHFRRR